MDRKVSSIRIDAPPIVNANEDPIIISLWNNRSLNKPGSKGPMFKPPKLRTKRNVALTWPRTWFGKIICNAATVVPIGRDRKNIPAAKKARVIRASEKRLAGIRKMKIATALIRAILSGPSAMPFFCQRSLRMPPTYIPEQPKTSS